MNITYLSCANLTCGIGRYTDELAAAVDSQTASVGLFRKQRGNLPFAKSYPYRSLRGLRHYVAPFYLRKALDGYQSDIWHADYVDSAEAVATEKLRGGAALFTTVHDAIPLLFPVSGPSQWNYLRQLRRAAELSDKLIVVSEQSKKDLCASGLVSPDKVEVIYNGINHARFYPNPKRVHNETPVLRYIGGLGGPYKNVGMLLETARILEDRNVDFKLEIGGGFPERTDLVRMASVLNLKKVTFTGFVPDEQLRAFYAGADLFLYPSLYEGFGFPPLEAMACGAATIAAATGSLPEVLGNGALLTPPHPGDFADNIVGLLNNDIARRNLSRRGLAVASRYSWTRAAEETRALYNNRKA